MKNKKSEKGSITVFVIIAFVFCMTILINLYWTSSNNQVTVLQAAQRIKAVYENDVENIDEIYDSVNSSITI